MPFPIHSKKLQFYCTLVLFASTVFFTSCDDEKDPAPDTVAPEFVTSLTDNKTVWNTVVIASEVTDDDIAQVEISVDGAVIKTFDAAPYSLAWDSNSVPDGSHTIKVTVTDHAGNESFKAFTIVVKNVLASIDIASNQLYDGLWSERGFVFLSDADGKLIASTEYKNAEDIELRAPDFDGEHFYVTEVLLSTFENNASELRMWTFSGVDRGKWVIVNDEPADSDVPEFIGEAVLNFSNKNPNLEYGLTASGMSHFESTQELSVGLPVTHSPGLIYATAYDFTNADAPPVYGIFENITVGNNAVNLGSVNKPMTEFTPNVPIEGDLLDGYVALYGYPVAGNYAHRYYLHTTYADEGQMTLYKPGTAFPVYQAKASFESEAMNFYCETTLTNDVHQLNFERLQYEGSIGFSNNTITYSVTGNFDFLDLTYRSNSGDAYWFVVLPNSTNKSVPAFEIPSMLQDLDVPVINGMYQSVGLYDFKGLATYADLLAFIRNSSASLDDLTGPGAEYVDTHYRNPATNGRRKAGKIKSAFNFNRK